MSLNLKGNELSGTVGPVLGNNGNLTVEDAIVSSVGVNGNAAIMNAGTFNGSNLTLNGAPQSGSGWPAYVVNNSGTAVLTDCNVTSNHGAIALSGETASVTINNSNITTNGFGGSSHIFYLEGGNLTINDGTYTNNGNGDGTIFGGDAGTVTVNGGTFVLNGGAYFALNKGISLIINDGDFSDITNVIEWGGSMTISGGTFGFDPTTYLATGCTAAGANGVWTVNQS